MVTMVAPAVRCALDAAEERFKAQDNGDMDWYALLNIADAASADTETIKRQYKRMSLMVYPDKNSSVAAKGAFKLISEA
uniref:J domain-containing protein n=1 Tax=Nelumbo nucifera TaxID=4432 RepID=A0A822Y893_NELNU|nr:TPA_asm: hypothetical protein HUJ06_030188 [Nelumbo nucifera]